MRSPVVPLHRRLVRPDYLRAVAPVPAWRRRRRGAVAIAAVGLVAVAASGCSDTSEPVATAAGGPTRAQQVDDDVNVDRLRTISVTGQGTTSVRPDTANVQLGVQVRGESAADTLGEANERAADLLAALEGLGVDADDVRTSGLSIYPTYDNQGRRVTGYEASNSVDVTIRDIDQAGEIIDGAAAFAGEAITIGGIWFSVSDPESALPAARDAAIANARARADDYANAAGVEVGDIVAISETGFGAPEPLFAERAMVADDAGVPIAPGTQEVAVTVTVVFELLST